MLREETFETETGLELVRHYSDAGMYILQNETCIEYEEAVDVLPCRYTYTETDHPLPEPETEPESVEESQSPEQEVEE